MELNGCKNCLQTVRIFFNKLIGLMQNIIMSYIEYINYDTGYIARTRAYFGRGTAPILLDDVGCSGTESKLTDCSYDPHTADCTHSEDAGAVCYNILCKYSFLRLRVTVCICISTREAAMNLKQRQKYS